MEEWPSHANALLEGRHAPARSSGLLAFPLRLILICLHLPVISPSKNLSCRRCSRILAVLVVRLLLLTQDTFLVIGSDAFA